MVPPCVLQPPETDAPTPMALATVRVWVTARVSARAEMAPHICTCFSTALAALAMTWYDSQPPETPDPKI